MIASFRQLRNCTSGAALLETVVVFPLVLILMLGSVEIGRAVHIHHTADKSMRSAARYLARVPEPATCDGEWGWERAKHLAVHGTIDPDVDDPLIDGWEDADVVISFPVRAPDCSAPNFDDPLVLRFETTVNITVQLLAGLGLPSTMNLRVAHEERHIGE